MLQYWLLKVYMAKGTKNRNIQIVLSVLSDEVQGNVDSAFAKLAPKYKMTWMYQGRNRELFPQVGPGIEKTDLIDVYAIANREYDIRNVAACGNVVMLELVEIYPARRGPRVYRTPLVLVLELKAGKIVRGRHYCDPRLSHRKLSMKQINEALD